MEGLGPLPVGATVGHGPRRLQSARQCVGVLPARSCAQSRVSLGGRRHRRIFGSRAAAVLGTGTVERARPDPKGAAIRAEDRKSTRLNSSHTVISYAVFCLKK